MSVLRGTEKTEAASRAGKVVTRDEIEALLGRITDAQISAIIGTGASCGEVEEAAAWAAGESDVMGEAEAKLTGAAAAVYDLLTAAESYENERR